MRSHSNIFRRIINIVIFGVVFIPVVILREKYEIMLNVKYDEIVCIFICGIYFVIAFPINYLIDRKKTKRKKHK